MKNPIYLVLITFLLLTAGYAYAQAPSQTKPVTPAPKANTYQQPPVDSTTLDGRYQLMLRRSKTQLGFKLVNPSRLSTLWKNASDTINYGKRKIRELQQTVTQQAATINQQKESLTNSEQTLAESKTEVEQVSLLGIMVSKSTYNLVMWGLVFLLAASLAIVIFSSGRNSREAKYRIKLYEELAAEYQAHKIKANDKEKKLARELQDERNKLDDLLKR
ncbi:hypothetical protein [Hufsiella ginkgonis]|uniref:tRNA (Guanine-N1)-methyltransferase n=1 Tax=Hufsiella ginkgonis TaxID=2695274 RepID=A0A7K1Y211_9SPHI|nr:hypothetical protein [Hufsiella ginkgonis]MXV17294.1 hypothetical protein [Hufsiella ginkgonis]